MKIRILFLFILLSSTLKSQQAWNKYQQNKTVTYDEAVRFYQDIDKQYPEAKLLNYGLTDCGKPLQLMIINKDKIFNRDSLKNKGYLVIMINNGIHPGEADGIDASIMLVHDILTGKVSLPAKTVLAIVPVYNIDGMLNNSCCTRANQNGPDLMGFRGNARNLDLNRDFIKCDSENAKSFSRMYTAWDPDVFIDTHVSDGADYQYIMTLIDTQKDKLHPIISKVMQEQLLPLLYAGMEQEKFPMCPYVEEIKDNPENGISGFLETPRYSSGYSALFNAFAFVTETHMLKPFPQRVESTYSFFKVMIESSNKLRNAILTARLQASKTIIGQDEFPLQWQLDTTTYDTLLFRGYKAKYKESKVTGLPQMYYDQKEPYTKYIKRKNNFKVTASVTKPYAYILPQAWKEVIERMQNNGVKMSKLTKDTLMDAEMYYIRDYKSGQRPYEGHYLHTGVKTESTMQQIQYHQGDYIIVCNQPCNRYIVECLEPTGVDAFFAWNFFDPILQQKEWFSDYIFEPTAEKILEKDSTLRRTFNERKANDSTFANDSWAMLIYIYQHSTWYEKSHLRYPVARINHSMQIPMLPVKKEDLTDYQHLE